MYDSGSFAALGFFMIVVGIVIIAVGIGIAVLFILNLYKALSRCAPQNRTTSPESAWFLLIPLFNLVWPFILYPRISETLEREFRQRNIPIEPQPAKNLGLALAILQACCIIPVVNMFAGIGALVCYIMYWIKISGYSNQLAAAAAQPQWTAPVQPAQSSPLNPPPPLASAAAASAQPAGVQPLPQSRHCTDCGASLQPAERFCGGCGKPVA